MKRLTGRQLDAILKKHPYVELRYYDGTTAGFNSRIALLSDMKRTIEVHWDRPSYFISYEPINFMQYITTKIPFE